MTEAPLAAIGTLWIDGDLSWLEIASLASFVATGHDIVLYTYGKVSNAPAGVQVRDAREVLDTGRIVIHKESGSPAIHADIFRVCMALKTGRVWVDTDVIALRPFTRDNDWFIGHERTDKLELGNAVLGLPATSATLRGLHDFLTADKAVPPWMKPKQREELAERWANDPEGDLGDLAWGTSGPKALTWFAEQTGEIAHARPQTTFFPVSFQDRKALVEPRHAETVHDIVTRAGSYSVHLYSRWLRKVAARSSDGLPSRHSWLGIWASENGIISYSSATRPVTATAAEPEPTKTTPEDEARLKAEAQATERGVVAATAAALDTLPARKAGIPGGANTSRHGRVSIVTMAKDEGPYILEWVAYHHVLGFTDIVAYTNDCTDGTDEMFDALAGCGLVTRLNNPAWKSKPPQSRALHWAEITPFVMTSDWLLVMDLDEFVCVKTGGHRIDDLIDAVVARNATGMCLTWRFYGSGGTTEFGAAPVTERLTKAAPDGFVKGYGIKTLFKTDPHMALAIHRPYLKMRFARTEEGQAYPVDWLNGSGDPLNGKDLKWRLNNRQVGYELAQMNHYGVKSREEYMLRRLRGDVLDNHSKYDGEYFGIFDRNEVEDDAALALKAERDALVAELLKVPAVRAAADLVEERRQAKLERLRASKGFAKEIRSLEPYPMAKAMKIKRN